MNDLSKELVAAISPSMILSILKEGESYGYDIVRRAMKLSDGHVQYAEGTLYPILKRMEQRKWIKASWKRADSGRSRKYYSITAAGEEALSADIDQWLVVMGILKRIWTDA
jgi:DNA-binding PadR family transcriptional regulator